MSVEKAFPIEQVVKLLKGYDWSGQRRLSFEYTMFAGVNDDARHAELLLRMLHGLECRVNLIRYHSAAGSDFRTSSANTMKVFCSTLMRGGVNCTIRTSRGEDIDAACGLLAGKSGS